MRTTITRQPTSFMLRTDLLDGLKANAFKEKSSLNSYVENLLLDVLYHFPNDVTKQAILEAKERTEYPTSELYGSADELFEALDKEIEAE